MTEPAESKGVGETVREAVHRRRRAVHIVLPAYNEAARLPRLLDRIDEAMAEAAFPYRVILVDDGSIDETHAIACQWAKRLPILVQRHAANQGLGPTLRDGLRAAAEVAEDRDVIVTMDADDTQTPALIPRMAEMIAEGYDVVIASRYQPGARVVGVPLVRRVMSRVGSWLFRLVAPMEGVRDFTCGYRAYRAGVIRWAIDRYGDRFIDQEGFQCMADLLVKTRAGSFVYGEVPLVLRYDQKQGASKMNVGRTIRKTLLVLLRSRFGNDEGRGGKTP